VINRLIDPVGGDSTVGRHRQAVKEKVPPRQGQLVSVESQKNWFSDNDAIISSLVS
jgi:hypothetical protein